MYCRMFLCLVAAIAVLLVRAGFAEPPKAAAAVGRKIADFTLPDVAGKSWTLPNSSDTKAVVVLFLGTECPVNNAYMPRLSDLHDAYVDSGVQFVAINANQQDTPKRIAEHAKRFAIPFPVLKDANNVIADRFGAARTPEAFVLDAKHVIRYRGRIDDQFGAGYKRPQPTHNDLTAALDGCWPAKP